jgi:thiol-disulfide isomerase/thioredoxin
VKSGRFSHLWRIALIVFLGFGLGSCAEKHEESGRSALKVPLDPQALELTPVKPDSIALVVAASGGKATLVNVWASWCDPCREEFPEIVRLAREYRGRGLEVIFISADFAEDLPNARRFLAAQGVDWPTYYKVGNDQRFIAALDQRWSGALPGTFVYDAQGHLRDYWEGKASYAKFEQRVRPVLSLPEIPVSTEAPDSSKEDRS